MKQTNRHVFNKLLYRYLIKNVYGNTLITVATGITVIFKFFNGILQAYFHILPFCEIYAGYFLNSGVTETLRV